MELITDSVDCVSHNFPTDITSNNNNNNNNQSNEIDQIDGDNETAIENSEANRTDNDVLYALNPLLSESLNNLVKRLERTKIPKPPPGKGHPIRKRAPRIHASLPNVFLPSVFDEANRGSSFSNDKKVQWTNKLNFDLERVKSYLRDNYNNWCDQKQRSRSIPTYVRFAGDSEQSIITLDSSVASQAVDFVCSRSKDENNMTIKFTKCDTKSMNNDKEKLSEIVKTPPELSLESNNATTPSIIAECDKLDSSNSAKISNNNAPTIAQSPPDGHQQSFSTHLYLDGAIIEPISPASPPQKPPVSQQQTLDRSPSPPDPPAPDITGNPALEPSDPQSADTEPQELNSSITTPVPSKSKRGRKPRKKKAQNVSNKKSKPSNSAAINDNNSNNGDNIASGINETAPPDLEPPELSNSADIIIINLSPPQPPPPPTPPPEEEIDDAVATVEQSLEERQTTDSPQDIGDSAGSGDGTAEQTNDLEVLAKSITDSSGVDTSMLPPRKRYKRLMYSLENNKQQTSPRDSHTSAAESLRLLGAGVDTRNISDSDLDNFSNLNAKVDDKETSKANVPRSRSKRKKKTVSSFTKTSSEKKPVLTEKLPEESINVSLPEPMECEKKPDPKENDDNASNKDIIEEKVKATGPVSKPESLKRSKREAAARGFANMVAMSLNNNNSSQSQDNSTESKQTPVVKKPSSSRPDSNDTSSEASVGKIFKRPRKSKNTEPGPTKSKIRRAKSPVSTLNTEEKNLPETNAQKESEAVVDIPKPKSTKKLKEKNTQEEIPPPSPNETIISNDSIGNQENIKFRKIRTNNYIDPKPLYWFEEVEKCGCKSSKLRNSFDLTEAEKSSIKGSISKKRLGVVWDCGDNCLNRLTYTECQPKICQCGETCGNQKIRKGEWAPGLKMKDCPGKGKGVITTKPIREGTFIIEYVGEVINECTFQDRMMNLYRDDPHHYCLHLDGEMLIDAYRSGSLARFVNHSCQPNCEMQKWMVNGAYRMCLFATENIPADTELCYDYNFCSFNTKNTQICVCGSASCRGFIGSKPRAEQTESQKDRKKLHYIFGRLLSGREKLFILRNSIFLLRNRELGRCQRLGIRKPQVSHGNRLPSTISEIKRRKAKKNQFLTQMSALNSIRSIKTRQLQNAQDNENLTRAAQLGQVLRDLYNTLLEQKDPLNPTQQLVAPFINGLNRKKYPEFFRMIGNDSVASLNQVYTRLLDGGYMTMMAFDQDILQMLQNVESYAGKQSNIGQCAERIKPIYKELKINSIALFEALTDESFDEKDKQKLISNNLQQITSALAAIKSHSQSTEIDIPESTSIGVHKNKKRKQVSAGGNSGARGRLERGAEVIKCICGFLIEAGHVMVQCDRCFVWQHAYCMNVARSSELADVTRMEPYYCHICLNIPTESLIREIPRHFVISDETIGSDNTLFWTLLKSPDNLFKIDDFVYIASDSDSSKPLNLKSKSSKNSPTHSFSMPIDLSRRTIMRIYSLWKDSNGQRWMEGGLFLRPYDNQLKSLIDKEPAKVTGTNKRKSSASAVDLSTHKWHQYEVVYTDFTKILPLDCCLGRCFVLNSYTFRHGRPLLQNTSLNSNLDVFVCDWMINQNGEWSELDPGYLKINTKPYCFEKFIDNNNAFNNDPNTSATTERFCRQFLAEDLFNIDEGFKPSVEPNINKSNSIGQKLSKEEKISIKMQSLKKIINKLVEFAYERNQNFPLSSTPSSASGSNPSSRGASPLCENSGGKSPLRTVIDIIHHGRRKSSTPKKLIKDNETTDANDRATRKPVLNELTKESTTIASDASDNSPQLMIVVDEFQQTPKTETNIVVEDISKTVEKASSIDEKDSEEKTISSVKENIDDQSNLGSEINFGDFVNLLKTTEPPQSCIKEKPTSSTKASKQKSSKATNKVIKKQSKKSKKKVTVKKSELKPVSEINPAEDEWVPVSNTIDVSVNRPRTRSRKAALQPPPTDEVDKCIESSLSNNNNSNTDVELILTGLNIKGIFTSNENPDQENTLPSKDQPSSSINSSTNPLESQRNEEEEDESTKFCFVKLERMKMKQKKDRENVQLSKAKDNAKLQNNNTSNIEDSSTSKSQITETLTVSLCEGKSDNFPIKTDNSKDLSSTNKTQKNYSKTKSQPNSSSSSVQSDSSKQDISGIQSTSQLTVSLNRNLSDDNETDNKPDSKNSGCSSTNNRSKRKKGVPKRIPFDFSYPQISSINSTVTQNNQSADTDATSIAVSVPVASVGPLCDNEAVDLSSCSKTNQSDQPDQPVINTQSATSDSPDPNLTRNESTAKLPPPLQSDSTISSNSSSSIVPTPSVPTTETRHIPAANDFSSIENISSN